MNKTDAVRLTFLTAWMLAGVFVPPASSQELVRDATYREAFSYIGGLRELSDGRVMIADPLDKSLLVLNMRTGTARQIGREGGGPQEYRQPDGVFALRGDTTLLVDLGNARFVIVYPDGSFGPTKPLTAGQPGTPSFAITLPEGVDLDGNVYFEARGGFTRTLPDSAVVVRMNWQSGVTDTVGTVKLPERKRQESGGRNDQRVAITPVPLSLEDGWSVGADGRVAIVRSSPYRVDWVERNGQVRQGPTMDIPAIRVRRAEREAWLNEAVTGGVQIGVSIENGVATTQMSRGGGGSGNRGAMDDYEWPSVMPPFRANRVRVDPNGNVWVERYVAAGDPPLVDVFGPDGRHQRTVTLPEGRRIVGFGAGTVYLVHLDDMDLQYLERYRIGT